MLTDFGKTCRKIRIDYGQILADMAQSLEVTSAYLSAVETGKRNVPDDWPLKITKIYNLSNEQFEDLKNAAYNSLKQVKINLEEKSKRDRELVLQFARRIDVMDEATKAKMFEFLSKK